MSSPLHHTRRAVAGLAVAVSLVAAAPAAADSIAYIKGGDVWVASPDGAKQVQLTHTGDLSSVSQADDGTMIALAPNDRLRKLSHSGKVLAEFATFASDGPNVSGAIDHFTGPFDPQISPDGKLVAFTWYNDSYTGSSSGACSGTPDCYVHDSRKGVGITRSDALTFHSDYGLLTGWEYPDWVDDDTLLRSYSQANMADDTVFNEIGPGKADSELDRWFYDEEGHGTVHDVEMTPDRKIAVGLGGNNNEELWVYRTRMEPFGAPDWKFSFFQTTNTPVVEYCYQYNKPVGGKFGGLTLSPDGRQLAYAVGDGIWITDVADIAGGCGALPTKNALKLPGGSSPDWGPADVPAAEVAPAPTPAPNPAPTPAPKPAAERVTLALAHPTKLRTALRKGLDVRLTEVPDGTPALARRGSKRVAAGTVKGGSARMIFTRAAKRSLRRKRSVELVLTAGSARTKLTLTK